MNKISGVDVSQVESFLLKAEHPVKETAPNLTIRVKPVGVDGNDLINIPPLSVGGVRIASITKD